jgi:hypothetical protein
MLTVFIQRIRTKLEAIQARGVVTGNSYTSNYFPTSIPVLSSGCEAMYCGTRLVTFRSDPLPTTSGQR